MGAVVGALLLVAAIIVVVVLVRRRNSRSSYASAGSYAPVSNFVSMDTAPAVSSAPVASSSSSVGMHSYRLTSDVVDQGEGVMQARRGDVVQITDKDWADKSSPWVWAVAGS